MTEDNDEDSDDDDGNMLNKLGHMSEVGDFPGNLKDTSEQEKLFGCGNSSANLARLTKSYQIAKSRALNEVTTKDYLLSPNKRSDEGPLYNVEAQAYAKALFYMYGACESLEEDQSRHIVHNLLRRYKIWNGEHQVAKKYLNKQIVVALEDDVDEDLSQIENIIKFLKTNSKFGKNVREIEEIGQTLSATLYKVSGSDEEFAIKVPKKIENQDEVAFFDIVY